MSLKIGGQRVAGSAETNRFILVSAFESSWLRRPLRTPKEVEMRSGQGAEICKEIVRRGRGRVGPKWDQVLDPP